MWRLTQEIIPYFENDYQPRIIPLKSGGSQFLYDSSVGRLQKFVDSPYYSESETLWRCGDGLFFEVPPLASGALLTTLRPLLENVLQTVDHLEISYLGAPFSWLEKSRNRMGRDLNCMGFHRSTFSNHEKGAPRQEISV
jgi:hypothetical protein